MYFNSSLLIKTKAMKLLAVRNLIRVECGAEECGASFQAAGLEYWTYKRLLREVLVDIDTTIQ